MGETRCSKVHSYRVITDTLGNVELPRSLGETLIYWKVEEPARTGC